MAGLAAMAAPGLAAAHSPIPGIGDFYSGLLHPFFVPAHLMALLALGLLIGQRGLVKARWAAIALLTSIPVGLAVSAASGLPDLDIGLLGGSLVIAAGVALARPVPDAVLVPGAAVIGLLIGLGSNPETLAASARWAALAGTWLGASLAVLWPAAMVEMASRPWIKLGVRIGASWIAASAMLVLSLSMLGKAH